MKRADLATTNAKLRMLQQTLGVAAILLTLFSMNHASASEPLQAGKSSKVDKNAAGAWQGIWDVTRDHPKITTKGGALALNLNIHHEKNSATPRVQWIADRALCESPDAPPCEWVGERGVATSARVVAGHLLVVIQVSADDSDPMVIWLERPQEGRSRGGTLISARGGLAYRLDADRQ